MNNNTTRTNKSICEKSMKLMTNIVKVSYISIATIGLRTHAPSNSLARATHNPAPSLPSYPRNLRPQEPSVSYLVPPGDTNKSSMSMIKDDESVIDRDAGDFIKKVRARNMKDANEMTNIYESILPPPPPHYMLQSSSSSY